MLQNVAVSLLITRENNFGNNNSTDNLNGYTTFAKEHQGIHRWAQNETWIWSFFLCKYWEYVPLTLLLYKKLKTKKFWD